MLEKTTIIEMLPTRSGVKKPEIERNRAMLSPEDFAARRAFWRYCQTVAPAAKMRAKKLGVPFSITPGHVDDLFMIQGWCCAISRVAFEPPIGKRGPFHPSLDRIVPARGYVAGNVRLVCLIVNFAMNKWGESALSKLILAIVEDARTSL